MVELRDTPRRAAVVGGGPAGLMAAQVLAERGISVTIVERMPTLGRKFLLAGRSGLNLTQSEPLDDLVARYVAESELLPSALRAFDPAALRTWSAERGEDTYIGSSGRVFPDSWRATSLLRAWLQYLEHLGVQAQTRTRWVGLDHSISTKTHSSVTLRLENPNGVRTSLTVDVALLALGGASWPRTGSDGSWVEILRDAGVVVNELVPSNVGVEVPWVPNFVERFEGQPLKNIVVQHGDLRVRGEVVITRRGLEGTPVYSLSSSVRHDLTATGRATLLFDLQPDLSVDSLRRRLATRRPKDSFSNWIRRRVGLSPVATALLRAGLLNEVGSDADEPGDIARRIKATPITVTALAPIERAISSSGGIPFSELDTSFMLTKLPGMFAAGEMIDWDAPTGGYLLQGAFSTGVAAAEGALRWLRHHDALAG